MLFAAYLPADRRQALARDADLPDRTHGAALFTDISGFTPLTEALARTLGPRQGADALTRQLNRVYDALIDAVDSTGGSVIGFSGDAITCWFADLGVGGWGLGVGELSPTPNPQPPTPTALRAVRCFAVECAGAIQGMLMLVEAGKISRHPSEWGCRWCSSSTSKRPRGTCARRCSRPRTAARDCNCSARPSG